MFKLYDFICCSVSMCRKNFTRYIILSLQIYLVFDFRGLTIKGVDPLRGDSILKIPEISFLANPLVYVLLVLMVIILSFVFHSTVRS